jgi:hypothetical protein
MSKPIELNKRQGGSYTKDPETGKTILVEQTKHQEITGFEQQKNNIAETKASKKTQAK